MDDLDIYIFASTIPSCKGQENLKRIFSWNSIAQKANKMVANK